MAKSKYQKVKDYFESGLWGINRVEAAVKKGWITPEQFEEITEETYTED